MTAPIRVLIADDHPPTRAGVRLALERDTFKVCAEAADGPTAVAAARRERPDVCLLDINMPGDGIKAAEEISRELPETAVVMLTVSRSDSDLFDALRVGASGYLLKDIDPARLPLALQGCARGRGSAPAAARGVTDRGVPRAATSPADSARGPSRRRADGPGVGGARADAPGSLDGRHRGSSVHLLGHRANACLLDPAQAARADAAGGGRAPRSLRRLNAERATRLVALRAFGRETGTGRSRIEISP